MHIIIVKYQIRVLLFQTIIITNMNDDKQKTVKDQQQCIDHQQPLLIRSQLYQKYQILNQIRQVSVSEIEHKFNQNNITYMPDDPYEIFHFDVERLFSSFPFYQINVKIAHFSLEVKAIRFQDYNQNLFPQSKSENENINFVRYQQKQFCLKKFKFKNEINFQRVFAMAIKEWSILKICSALQCAPHIENYFGFDIIIFNDYIQFASEKGQKITQCTLLQQKQLNEELSLMHNFKIIHFDIKPENIIFSSYFGKPVFIDFGLSQIIKEERGYKTLSAFRGTPNFSSPEVLAIMNESQSYVDLYYNDAFGLNLSFKYIQSNKQVIVVDKDDDHFVFGYPQIMQQMIQSELKLIELILFLKFQYHYLSREQHKAKQFINDLLRLVQDIAPKILSFMKRVMREVFFSSILIDDLKKYSNLASYKDIELFLITKSGRLILKPQKYQEASINERQDICIKVEPISYNGSAFFTQNYQNYTKIIMSLKKFEEETVHNFLTIIFETVRFDIKNIDFSCKVILIRKVIQLLSAFMGKDSMKQVTKQRQQIKKRIHQNAESEGIEIMKTFILLLLEFCFKNRNEKWVKNRIFDIFQQAILLDINISHLIEPLLTYIDNHYQNALQIIQSMVECTRLRLSAKMIATEHIQHIKEHQEKLSLFSNSQFIKFKQKAKYLNNLQLQSICKFFDITQRLNQYGNVLSFIKLDECDECLNNIKHSKIRRYMYYRLTYIKLQSTSYSLNNDRMVKLIEQIKISELRKLDLLSFVHLNMRIAQYTGSLDDINTVCNYISSVTNCKYIYRMLYKIIMISTGQLNFTSINERIDYCLQKYRYYSDIHELIQYQLPSIIAQISNNQIAIDSTLSQKIIILYGIYEQLNLQDRSYDGTIQNYLSLLYRIPIQLFYYLFSQDTKKIFVYNMQRSKQELQMYKQAENVDYLKLAYKQFRYTYYEYKMCLYNKQYQKSTNYLYQMIKFSIKMDMHFIALQIFIDLNAVSQIWRGQNSILNAALGLYDFCENNGYYSFYLLQRSKSCTIAAIDIFGRLRQQKLHQLLLKLIQIICQHPFECYFSAFMILCDIFLQVHPYYVNALNFRKFQGNHNQVNLQTNPYLLIFYVYSLSYENAETQMKIFEKIANNCDRLSKHAKIKILQKYFCIFLLSKREEVKKRRLFIFRHAKCYIAHLQPNKEQARQLFRIKRSAHNRQKINCIINKSRRLIQCL